MANNSKGKRVTENFLFCKTYSAGRCKCICHPGLTICLVLCLMLSATVAVAQPKISLSSDVKVATAGFFQLRWKLVPPGKLPQGTLFILQMAASRAFDTPQTLYRGPDRARSMSGLSNGDYYFRVGLGKQDVDKSNAVSEWGNILKVQVKHHSLERALGFFFFGLVIFLGTLAVIIGGSLKSRSLTVNHKK